jgi:hypothetical protein
LARLHNCLSREARSSHVKKFRQLLSLAGDVVLKLCGVNLLSVLGNVGIGLVIGWLIGHFSRGPHSSRLRDSILLASAFLLVCLESFFFTDWTGVVSLVCTTGVTLLTHLIWQHTMNQRQRLYNFNKGD